MTFEKDAQSLLQGSTEATEAARRAERQAISCAGCCAASCTLCAASSCAYYTLGPDFGSNVLFRACAPKNQLRKNPEVAAPLLRAGFEEALAGKSREIYANTAHERKNENA